MEVIIIVSACLVTSGAALWIVATTPPERSPEPVATFDEMRNL
jgi:hypothetical protein